MRPEITWTYYADKGEGKEEQLSRRAACADTYGRPGLLASDLEEVLWLALCSLQDSACGTLDERLGHVPALRRVSEVLEGAGLAYVRELYAAKHALLREKDGAK